MKQTDTPSNADDVAKLLDRGDLVVMYTSALGSYTAVSIQNNSPAHPHVMNEVWRALGATEESLLKEDGPDFGPNEPGVTDTDDATPSQALYRLAEKATV